MTFDVVFHMYNPEIINEILDDAMNAPETFGFDTFSWHELYGAIPGNDSASLLRNFRRLKLLNSLGLAKSVVSSTQINLFGVVGTLLT